MNRRDAIFRVAGVVGGAFSVPFLTGLSTLERLPSDKTENKNRSVSDELQKMIEEVAELIIPETKTPGAKTAKVPEFILMMIEECYAKEDQTRFYHGLEDLNIYSNSKFGKSFLDSTPEEQTNLLIDLEKEAKSNSLHTLKNPPFILMMKELTLFGFFTSEIGCTQALEYLPIPGEYKPCFPLEPNQKTWAL